MAKILWISRCLRATPAVALLLVSVAHGQTHPTAPPQSVEDALHQMSDKAGVIFAGQVIAVRRQDGGGLASGVIEIEFRVDQAVRGCNAGTPYVLREWAGLWDGGNQRYRVGQRLLMLLHTPGPSGMSSPISGMDGAIPIHGGNTSAAQYSVADLRWVATKLLHSVSYRPQSAHSVHSILQIPFVAPQPTARVVVAGEGKADVPITPSSAVNDISAASIPAQEASVDAVIGILTSQQKAQDAVR